MTTEGLNETRPIEVQGDRATAVRARTEVRDRCHRLSSPGHQ